MPDVAPTSRGTRTKVATLSTESTASSSLPVGAVESCAGCGAPLAADQRYCLECGERNGPPSSVLGGGSLAGAKDASGKPPTPPLAPSKARPDGPAQRGNTVTVIAGVGVLLIAMGVGVLIGRSGNAKQVTAPPQVINLGTAGAGAGAGSTASTFTDDWPSGTTGYTVQLQTLPQTGTQVSAVEAAKAAASAKGASGVGALKSEDFSSLPAGNYVIYSGVYHKRPEAVSALAGLKKKFPGAAVVEVSNGGAGSGGSGASGAGAAASGAGGSISHPAPPSVLKNLRKGGGQSYEQKSKNLPNVVETP